MPAAASSAFTAAWRPGRDWTALALGLSVALVTVVFLLYPLANAMLLAFIKNGEAPAWTSLTD